MIASNTAAARRMRGSEGLISKASDVSQRPSTSAPSVPASRPAPVPTGLPQYCQTYLGGRCAEGHPDPDLLRALAHGVGEHTVQTQCGEQQRHCLRTPSSARARIARDWTPDRRRLSAGQPGPRPVPDRSSRRRRARPPESSLAEAELRRHVRAPSCGYSRTDDERDTRRASSAPYTSRATSPTTPIISRPGGHRPQFAAR